MGFAKVWLKGLIICLGLWLTLGHYASAQTISKEKKKLFFWQRNKEDVLDLVDTIAVLDSLDRPELAQKKDSLAEEEKKGKQKKKKTYFGYRVKKGFVRTGKGAGQIVTTFYYLKDFKEPSTYVPDKYYFDVKQRKIFKTRVLDPKKTEQMFILHGPFTRKQNDVLIEEGYFYIGAKHLRWETYRSRDSVLTKKEHYDKGFLRDAVIHYYDDAHTKIKEVIPYQYGQVQGMYYSFYENGQPEWQGMYDKGRKVGVWINYYDFRGRRRFEFQYPESAFEPTKEPVMVRQYDRHGTMVFEKK